MGPKRVTADPRVAAYEAIARILDDVNDEVLSASNEVEEERDWADAARRRLEEAIAAARVARAEAQREATKETSTVVRLHEVAALSMKTLRTASTFTQQQLADEMVALGFVTWKR